MKSQNKFMMMIFLTCAAGIAAAQPGARGGQQGMQFSMLDLNADGLVSEEEFNQARADFMAGRAAEGRQMRNAANAPGFKQMDLDGDGMLDPQELARLKQLRQEGMRDMQGKGAGGGRGHNRPAYQDFDLNKDGAVEEYEFTEARNQRISERASQGYAMRGLSNMRPFSALDTDADGILSQQEFAEAQAAHRP